MRESIESVIFCSREREERLRRRRELYRLRRSTETPEQRELRLAARREQERRRRATMTSEDRQALTQRRRGTILQTL